MFRLLPGDDLALILYPAISPRQAFSFVAGWDFTMGVIGFPGRSAPGARVRGVEEVLALPATDFSLEGTRRLAVMTFVFFCLLCLYGVLKRLSRAGAGLSPFVFCAKTAAGASRNSQKSSTNSLSALDFVIAI